MKNAAGPGGARSGTQLCHDRLDAQRILADHQRPELVDCALQCAGQRTTEIRHPDPDDTLVGFGLQSDANASPLLSKHDLTRPNQDI